MLLESRIVIFVSFKGMDYLSLLPAGWGNWSQSSPQGDRVKLMRTTTSWKRARIISKAVHCQHCGPCGGICWIRRCEVGRWQVTPGCLGKWRGGFWPQLINLCVCWGRPPLAHANTEMRIGTVDPGAGSLTSRSQLFTLVWLFIYQNLPWGSALAQQLLKMKNAKVRYQ